MRLAECFAYWGGNNAQWAPSQQIRNFNGLVAGSFVQTFGLRRRREPTGQRDRIHGTGAQGPMRPFESHRKRFAGPDHLARSCEVVWPCKPLSVRFEGPHWALGTGPMDPVSLARWLPAAAKAEWLNKRPSNKTVEIANLLTRGPLCIVSSSICEAFSESHPCGSVAR